MSNEAALEEAEILLDSYGEGPLLRLAMLASPACSIETQLVRLLRLECVPEAGVSVEQELWFSDLVASRGTTIRFSESVSHLLRQRLRDLRALEPELVLRARSIMAKAHRHFSPILVIEDELAWAAVFDDDDSIRGRARDLLQSLQARRDGLDLWLGRAWGGLPAGFKELPEGRQLAQVAAASGASIEAPGDEPQAEEVAHLLPTVPLLIQRKKSTLLLNVPPQDATHAIDVPDTRPRKVEVRFEQGTTAQSRVFEIDEVVAFDDIGPGTITVTTLSGAEFDITAQEESTVFAIELMPAGHGTSALIRYGEESRVRRILIDCGERRVGKHILKRLEELPPDSRHLELLVLTHIDANSLGGAIPLLQNQKLGLQFDDVWFNGRQHLEAAREEN